MQRIRTWEMIPAELRVRNRTLPFDAGDGATLALDFTETSALDPRFTFARSSNATYVNSNGIIAFADNNLVVNSTFGSLATPQGWSGSTGVSLTTPSVGVRRAVTTTAAQNWIQTSNVPTSTGLTYSTSVYINDVSGQHYANTITITASPTSVTYYRNGVSVGQFDTAQPGLISMTWTASTGSGHYMRVGIGATGANVANAVCEFTEPQTSRGTNAQPTYFANTSTASAYYAPRFDYSPTTLTPRGLLIEGSATNLLCWSESFATSGGSTNWGYNSNTGAVVSTSNPAGGSTAFQFAETANSGPLQQSVTVTNAIHTFSAWFKGSTYSGTTTTQVQFGLYVAAFVAGTAAKISGPGSVSVAGNVVTLSGLSTNEWTRVQFTTTAALSAVLVAILIYPNSTGSESNASFYIWGAQLEAGSGASSYIPTGASTVQRAADVCTLSSTNFSSWFNNTEGTFLATGERSITSNFGRLLSANANNTTAAFDLGASTSGRWLITNTTSQADITAGTVSANTAFKVAGAFANNDAQMAFNGTLGTADTSVSLPTASQLDIGADRTAVYLNGRVRSIKFWPTRLPNATLQSLTA